MKKVLVTRYKHPVANTNLDPNLHGWAMHNASVPRNNSGSLSSSKNDIHFNSGPAVSPLFGPAVSPLFGPNVTVLFGPNVSPLFLLFPCYDHHLDCFGIEEGWEVGAHGLNDRLGRAVQEVKQACKCRTLAQS